MFTIVSVMLFMMLYLVPFIPCQKSLKIALCIILILLAYFSMYSVASILFKWGNSFVNPENRAEYSATKEIISLLSGIIFTFAAGFVIDKFESIGNLNGGFLFIAVTILICAVCNFITLMLINKDVTPKSSSSLSVKDVIENTLKNRDFNNVLILTILWDVTRYTTIGFMGIYKTKELMLSVGFVQVINITGNIIRALVSKPLGRYSDKHSFVKGFKLALYIAALSFFINIFSTPSTIWCIVAFTVLNAVSIAGTNQNSSNILYSYVKSDYFVHASAIKNSIGGLCGFLSSICAGKLLSYIQANGNMIFGISVYGQQVLSFISLVTAIISIIFIKTVMEKQKVMKQ